MNKEEKEHLKKQLICIDGGIETCLYVSKTLEKEIPIRTKKQILNSVNTINSILKEIHSAAALLCKSI